MKLRALLVFALLAAAPAVLPQQTQTAPAEAPAFPSKVELVTVDAVVVDAKGRAVPGLTQADFTVLSRGGCRSPRTSRPRPARAARS